MVVAEIEGVVKLVVPVPPASGDPPVAAAYQSIVSPVLGFAEMLTTPDPQRDALEATGAAVIGRMVMDLVATALLQPPVPLTV